jgi:hypothetical protein
MNPRREVKPAASNSDSNAIGVDDPTYQLWQEILEAEKQIQRDEVVSLDEVKRQHDL